MILETGAGIFLDVFQVSQACILNVFYVLVCTQTSFQEVSPNVPNM